MVNVAWRAQQRLHRSWRHLALKTADRFRDARQRLWQHLKRDEPIHPAMAGFEHSAHATLTELVENDVIPQDEPALCAAGENVGLVARQLVLLNQPLD